MKNKYYNYVMCNYIYSVLMTIIGKDLSERDKDFMRTFRENQKESEKYLDGEYGERFISHIIELSKIHNLPQITL